MRGRLWHSLLAVFCYVGVESATGGVLLSSEAKPRANWAMYQDTRKGGKMSKQAQQVWLTTLIVIILFGGAIVPPISEGKAALSLPPVVNQPASPKAAPLMPQQASGQGGIFIDVEPRVVPAYDFQVGPYPLVAIASSGWLPYDSISIRIDDDISTHGLLTATPAGFFVYVIVVDQSRPGQTVRVRLESYLTGQSASGSFYVTEPGSTPLPGVAVAPHQAHPGDYVAVLGVNYANDSTVTFTRSLNEVLASRYISTTNSPCHTYSEAGCTYAIVRVPLTATDGAQVYGIYSDTLGATLGQSVEERTDAHTALVPRAYADQGIWRSGSPRRTNQVAEGFLPGELVSVGTSGRPSYNLTADQQGTVYSSYDYAGGGAASVGFTYSGQSSGRRAYARQLFQPQGSDQPSLLISPSFALRGQSQQVVGSGFPASVTGTLELSRGYDGRTLATLATDAAGSFSTTLLLTNTSYYGNAVSFEVVSGGLTTTANADLYVRRELTATAYLTGLIQDASNAAPLGGMLWLSNSSGQRQAIGTTAAGVYTATDLAPGDYTIRLLNTNPDIYNTEDGCYLAQQQTINLQAGANRLDFAMKRAGPNASGYACYDGPHRDYSPLPPSSLVLTSFGVLQNYQLPSGSQLPFILPFAFPFYGQSYTTGTIETLGFLRIGQVISSTYGSNTHPDCAARYLPGIIAPNASYLVDSPEPGAGVYRAVVGTVPHRRFVVEWRNYAFPDLAISYVLDPHRLYTSTMQLQLDEGSGDIFMLYPQVAPGGDGIVGATGVSGFGGATPRSHHCPLGPRFFNAGSTVRFFRGNLVSGRVTAANGGGAVAGVLVRAVEPSGEVTQARTDSSGAYSMTLALATNFTLTVAASGYQTLTTSLNALPAINQPLTRNFSLLTTQPACNLSFTDVASDNIFYADIQALACTGIVNGLPNSNGTYRFEPNSNTTRGEFAKIVVRGYGLPRSTPAQPSFRDVPASHPFYLFIESAVAVGAVTGYSEPAACPSGATPCYRAGERISRVQVAVILKRVGQYPTLTPTIPTFADVPSSAFGYSAVETLVSRGAISGAACDGGGLCFRPNDPIRRGELSKVVRRALAVSQP